MSKENTERVKERRKEDIIPSITDFFRETSAMKTISESLLPLIQPHTVATVGCSTGEEVYSLLGLNKDNKELKIYGYDRKAYNIERAKKGSYYDVLLQFQYEKDMVNDLFYSGGNSHDKPSEFDSLTIPYDLKQRASFETWDISKLPLPQKFPIILCANMLYYYAEKNKANSDVPLETILTNITNSLIPGGFLVCESESSSLAKENDKDPNYASYPKRLRNFPLFKERKDLVIPDPNRMEITNKGIQTFNDRAMVFQLITP